VRSGSLKTNFLNFTPPNHCRHFLLTGSEDILKLDALEIILQHLKGSGFRDKITVHQEELSKLEDAISRNIGGSLFQELLIIHVRHSSGKFPEQIKASLENSAVFQADNLAIILESSIEKTPASGAWLKNFNDYGAVIDCKKLNTVEEKLWLKRQLAFLPKDLLPAFGGSIFQNNEGNLLGQKNESKLLKLLFSSEQDTESIDTEHHGFNSGLSVFELEDILLQKNFTKVLATINFLQIHDKQSSAPLIWLLAKVVSACLGASKAQNKKAALAKSGIWSSKISLYLKFMEHGNSSQFMDLNERILKLDLVNKGVIRLNVWEQIEQIILQLQVVTQPLN